MSEPSIAPTSRYAHVEKALHERPDGVRLAYLRRRFVPPPGARLGEHVVVEGDRPDGVAARHLGDPDQYWRLCDDNLAMHPRDLTSRVGRRLTLRLPGVPLG